MKKLKDRIDKLNADYKNLQFNLRYAKGWFKEEKITEARPLFSLPMPEELCDFYRTFEDITTNSYGDIEFELNTENLITIISKMKRDSYLFSWESMGLADHLENFTNSDNGWRFRSLDKTMLAEINANYQYIGGYTFEDKYNKKHFIYFDKNQKFGTMYFDLNDFETLEANLKTMATQSPAYQGLEELMISIIDQIDDAIKATGQAYYIENEPNVKTEADKLVMDAVAKELKKAKKLADKEAFEDNLKAVVIYKNCIEKLTAANQTEGNQFIVCHNEIFNIYYPQDDATSEAEALAYAYKTLALLPKGYNILEYYRRSLMWVSAIISHFILRDETDPKKLEEALEIITYAADRVYYSDEFLIYSHKITLLLELNRKEEAFTTLQFVINKAKKEYDDFDEENYYDLKTFIESKEFKAWQNKQNEAANAEIKTFIDKTERIIDNVRKQMEANQKQQFVQQIPPKEIITYAEAESKYFIENYYNRDADDKELIFLGDLYIKGDFDNAWFDQQLEGMHWEGLLYGAVIVGNLYIEGDYIDSSSDRGIELKVMGNIECHWLFSEDGRICIKGDLTAKYGISGNYNHGSLETYGKITTPYILNSDHDMEVRSESEFVYMAGGDESEKDYIYLYKGDSHSEHFDENSHTLIAPKIWNKDDEFQLDVFIEMVKNGENPFVLPE